MKHTLPALHQALVAGAARLRACGFGPAYAWQPVMVRVTPNGIRTNAVGMTTFAKAPARRPWRLPT
jgi:hypothetical protein